MRIVVLDGYMVNPGDNPWDAVAELGELVVHDRTPPDQVRERAADAEIVLTNKTVLDAAAIAALPRLCYVSVLATGYDTVDVAAARRRGIPVSNVPEYSSASVAQHTLALLLELCNRAGDHARAAADGAWARNPDYAFWLAPPLELDGLTMGIVGFGRIGRRAGELARAFGMRVVASSAGSQPGPDWPGFAWRPIPELFAEADVVSLHCPLTAANERFVDAALLARMKPTAFLLNTARGGLIDESALAAALEAGRIAGAGLDVLAAEPPREGSPLLNAPRCLVTPHIAWASLAARRRLMSTTAGNIAAFLAGAPVNVVNG